MTQGIPWDKIPANDGGEFASPPPGGYVVEIKNVFDVEDKQYLKIEWDYTEAPWAGYNRDTYARAEFWPSRLIRSYKTKALPFFKAFKEAVEASNRGYVFHESDVQSLRGKLIGVVLREEEYMGNGGEIRTRLDVAQVKTVDAIRANDFTIPAKKRYTGSSGYSPQSPAPSAPNNGFSGGGFMEVSDEDGDLPFD